MTLSLGSSQPASYALVGIPCGIGKGQKKKKKRKRASNRIVHLTGQTYMMSSYTISSLARTTASTQGEFLGVGVGVCMCV